MVVQQGQTKSVLSDPAHILPLSLDVLVILLSTEHM